MNKIDELLEAMLAEDMETEDRVELRRIIQAVQARYEVGDRVRIHGLEDEFTIVDMNVYGPSAQFFGVVHDHPEWKPPTGFSANTNYGRPRLNVCLDMIVHS